MGRFADAEIGRFSDEEFGRFEALIELPDRELFAWIAEREPTPLEHDSPVFRRLKAFHKAFPTTEHIG